jgi:hypothetical protein
VTEAVVRGLEPVDVGDHEVGHDGAAAAQLPLLVERLQEAAAVHYAREGIGRRVLAILLGLLAQLPLLAVGLDLVRQEAGHDGQELQILLGVAPGRPGDRAEAADGRSVAELQWDADVAAVSQGVPDVEGAEDGWAAEPEKMARCSVATRTAKEASRGIATPG